MSLTKPNIAVFAPPGSGKTYALLSLVKDESLAGRVLLINADGKSLPWFGHSNFASVKLDCPTQLPEMIRQASAQTMPDGTPRFKYIIVDTITRVMETYVSRYIGSSQPKYVYDASGNLLTNMNYVSVTKAGTVDSLAGWGRGAALFRDIMGAGDISEAQMIYTSHMTLTQAPDNTYTYEAPIQGSIGKTGLSAWFSITVVARCVPMEDIMNEPDSPLLTKTESRKGSGTKFVFQIEKTKDTQAYPIRNIDGMFPQSMTYINNDYKALFEHLDKLYAGQETGLEHLD